MTSAPRGRGLAAGLVVVSLSVVTALAAPPAPPNPAKEAGTRVRELRTLAAKGPQSAPALVAALKDPSATVRAAAVQLLAEVKKRAAVPDIAPLIDDADDNVAVAAVGALFVVGGDATLAPLRRALASPSERVRHEAASGAGDARDARLVRELGALLSDDSPALRRTALEALRAIGDPSTFPFLMAATGDKNGPTAASAIGALESLHDPRALVRLAQLGGSTEPAVRAAVAHAIPALGGLGAQGPLMAKLAQDPDPGVRGAVATGLRDAPAADGTPLLSKLVTDTEPSVRRVAVQALREQKDPKASAGLAAATADADENIRASAVLALGTRGAKEKADAVGALAQDPSERVRGAVASTLGDLGRSKDLVVLEKLAADPAPTVRAAAVVGAARIGSPAALPIVDRGVKDPDLVVRLETVRALGLLEVPESLDRLRTLAGAGDLASRVAAIEQLGVRKDKGSLALLRKLAQDPVERLRSAARHALEAIGT